MSLNDYYLGIERGRQDAKVEKNLSDGAPGAAILLLWFPILFESFFVGVISYFLVSPHISEAPFPFPTLGLHPIVGLFAAFSCLTLYVILHASKIIQIALFVLLTPIWAFAILCAENSKHHFGALGKKLLTDPLPALHTIYTTPHVSWGWTLFVVLTLLLDRYFLYVSFAEERSAMRRRGFWRTMRAAVQRVPHFAFFLLVISAICFVLFKACTSTQLR